MHLILSGCRSIFANGRLIRLLSRLRRRTRPLLSAVAVQLDPPIYSDPIDSPYHLQLYSANKPYYTHEFSHSLSSHQTQANTMSSSSSSNLAKLLALMTEDEIAAFLAAKEAAQKKTPSQTTPDSAAAQQPPPHHETPSQAPSSKPEEEKREQPQPSPSKQPESTPAKDEPSKKPAASYVASSPDLGAGPADPTSPKSISHTSPPHEKMSSSPPQTHIPRLQMVPHDPEAQPVEVLVADSREGGLPDARASYAKRNVIPPVIVVPEILQGLADELDLHEAIAHLDRLGWLHLETEPFQVDLDEVTRFYSALTPQPPAKSQEDPNKFEQQCVGTLMHEEDIFVVGPKLIAKLLNLSTGSGYRVLQKKNWPSGGKTGVLKEIYGHSQVHELTNDGLLWPLKVVHYVLAKNVIPRQENATRLTI